MAVTLALAKQQLEYEADDRDELIQQYIASAESSVKGITGLDVLDHPDLDDAVLLIVAARFDDREGLGEQIMGMPPAAEALCHKRRKMAV